MKKLSILAAILAMGTICVAGCNMGGPDSADVSAQQPQNITVLEEKTEENPTPAPDDNCDKKGNCNHGKMPYRKPGFKFITPHIKRGDKDGDKFRHPHKKPAPEPENPETPAVPEENGTN